MFNCNFYLVGKNVKTWKEKAAVAKNITLNKLLCIGMTSSLLPEEALLLHLLITLT